MGWEIGKIELVLRGGAAAEGLEKYKVKKSICKAM